ncbi:MAG: twin-arginine translocase subunit TatC [Gemmatimonadetes bacterium]|nr:twin-arginine translocase subunit TatC [Gemmatimonadota bacterium]
MPFLDHLEELRRRILINLAAAILGSALGVALAIEADVIGLLLHPLDQAVAEMSASGHAVASSFLPTSGRLHFLSLTEPFFFVIKIRVATGLLVVSPVIIYQAWAFLSPALTPRERRVIIPSLYLGVALFLAGVALAYFVALPISIRFLLLFGSDHFTPMLTAGYYLSFVVSVMLAFGILFEMPTIIMIMAGLGLVTPAFLRAKRRAAYVLLTVLACVVTPGDLWATSALLVGPLLVLYELSILLAALITRKRGQEPGSGGMESVAAISLLLGIRLRRMAGPRLVRSAR